MNAGAGLETVQLGRVLTPRNRRRGQPGDVNRNVELPGERDQAADMIGMLVRDQDRVQTLGCFADSGQPRETSRLLSPASTRMRVRSVRMNVEFPELLLASTQTLTIMRLPSPLSCRLGQRRAVCLALRSRHTHHARNL